MVVRIPNELESMRNERDAAVDLIRRLVLAMEMWGGWGEGAAGPARCESGRADISTAYFDAKKMLKKA